MSQQVEQNIGECIYIPSRHVRFCAHVQMHMLLGTRMGCYGRIIALEGS